MSIETKALPILEQTLVDAINSTKEGISKGIDFANQQIPDVIEQLLEWKLVEAIVICLICVAPLFVCIWVLKKHFKDSDGVIIIQVAPVAIVSLVVFIANALSAIKIVVAPKIFLLEYLAELIR